MNRDVGWQTRFDFFESGLDGRNHLLRVRAGPRDDDSAHCFGSALDERRDAERIADFHGSDLADEDRHTILRSHDDAHEIVRPLDEPRSTDDRPRAVALDDVAADVAVALHDGTHDLTECETVAPQLVGIDVNLVLLDGAADRGHFCDTGNAVQLIPDEPVLKSTEISKRSRR